MSISELVHSIYKKVNNQFSESDFSAVRRALTDNIAAIAAGLELSRQELFSLYSNYTNHKEATLIKDINSISLRALLLGTSSHSAELDDGIISGIIHPGSPIISTLLAYNCNEIPAKDFFKSIVLGYEISTVIAELIQPVHKQLGYHATATSGLIGATAALTYLNSSEINDCIKSINIAANYATGSLASLNGNSNIKSVNVGITSQLSIISYLLACSGFNGPDDALFERFGFFERLHSGVINFDQITSRDLAIKRAYNKPYASCRYCHPTIDCILKLQSQKKIPFKKIKNITIKTYDIAIENHDHVNIQNPASAKMSIPYNAVCSILYNAAGLSEFSEKSINHVNKSKLLSKVNVASDKNFSKSFPLYEPASVLIEFLDGASIKAEVDNPLGSVNNPMSNEAIKQKLIKCFAFSNNHNGYNVLDVIWDNDRINIDSLLDDFYVRDI